MRYLCLLLLFLAVPLTTALSMGVSPPRIVKDNLLPGSELQEVIVLNRNNDARLVVRTTLQGDVSDWIRHPEEVVFSEGVTSLHAPFTIRVPEDAAAGSYSAAIEYFVASEDNLHILFSVPVDVVVIEENDFRYQVKHVAARQENGKMLLSFDVNNKGNVRSGPTSAKITVVDNVDEVVVYEGKQKIRKTDPFTIEEKTVSFTPKLPKGYYWVDVLLVSEDQEFTERVLLEVENNQLTGNAALRFATLSENVHWSLFVALGALLFVLVVVMRRK